jgi:hypothetical protein
VISAFTLQIAVLSIHYEFVLSPLQLGLPFSKLHQRLQFLDHLPDFVFSLSELLLKPSKEFILFTFRKLQIIIGEISVLLFEIALQLVPRAFDLKLVHKKLDPDEPLLFTSGLAKSAGLACQTSAMWFPDYGIYQILGFRL